MPVAAEHDAVEAEALDAVGDVGPQLVARPVLVVGLGRHAGNLAMDVALRCERLDVPAPGLGQPGLDAGLADVVEHEADVRALPDHLDHVGQMVVEDADVEAEVVRRQQLEAGDEVGLDAEIGIGLGLDEPPHRAQDLVPAKPIEFGLDGVAVLERKCRDHAFEFGL